MDYLAIGLTQNTLMAKQKVKAYEGPPLKLNIGIGTDRAQLMVNPVTNSRIQTCCYCTTTCENDPNHPQHLFYTFPVHLKSGVFMVTACAFCTQARYMNLVGEGRGEIYVADYISQNNVIMFYTACKSGIYLSNKHTEALAEDPMLLAEGGGSEFLQKWMEVGAQCSSSLSSLKGIFTDDLMKFNMAAKPAVEQDNIVNYLLQLSRSEYNAQIKQFNTKFRYLPREISENQKIVEYFADYAVGRKYPITDWKAIAQKHEAHRKLH